MAMHGEDSPKLDAPTAPDNSLTDCFNITAQEDKKRDNTLPQ